MKKICISLPIITITFSLFGSIALINEPYGVCAHVSRGEWQYAPQTFAKMKSAGINWVRTDFDWRYCEPKEGQWQYNHLDRLMKLAKKENINVLPILDYDVPWARPAWKHLDKWIAYVRNLVSRYPEQMYWEVWNEQNSTSFWRDTPSGTNYATLLKRTYQEIKAHNPRATVFYGGTAGVPLAFIEESLKAGAGDAFDVMNIHPYKKHGVPEMMIGDFARLRIVMNRYNVAHKPIWITEQGWSTAKIQRFYVDLIPAALTKAGIDPTKSTVAIIHDPEQGFFESPNFDADFNLSMFRKIERIPLRKLTRLDVKKFPVLVPSASEKFPMFYMPQIIDYLKRGGTLILPAGLPFYYDMKLDGKGGATTTRVGAKHMKELHIDWETWWVNKAVPKQEKWQKAAPEFDGKFNIPSHPASRFFTASNLKEGDQFIPIIEAGADDYKGVICALYKFNSELKGNIIAYSGINGANDSVNETLQAQMLPRTYIIALANRVERIFWYNFRAGEWKPNEREHHFGIVHKDFTPKPAFQAYKTMTKMCPSGSTIPAIETHGKVYLANWIRPDGIKVWSIWTAVCNQKVDLQITGNMEETVNHLGENSQLSKKEYIATPSMLYLVGPEKVTIKK